ncbi:MAG TPA: exosortase-associated EpsI family protein [Terriglobales bacterium]|nr:exosortase-associated EpsI family protein [Terriglobales bacterium]
MRNFRGNMLMLVGCLLAGIVVQAILPARVGQFRAPADERLASLPYHFGRFAGREAHGAGIKGYPGELHRIYHQADGSSIELLAYPAPLSEHGPQNCLPYLGWSIIERKRQVLQANPRIELQTVVAVSDNPARHPLVCGFYWRKRNRATANLLTIWLQQRWATITQSLQDAELVNVCASISGLQKAGAAAQQVYEFANDLEPFFQPSPPRPPEPLSRVAKLRAPSPEYLGKRN